MMRRNSAHCLAALLLASVSAVGISADMPTGVPIPGTGTKVDYVGDTFEDASWQFVHNMPKGSRENNDQAYGPSGFSANRRWYEGPERGQPDIVQLTETPAGGPAGSERALLLRTLNSGVPSQRSFDVQQDDLIAGVSNRLGTEIQADEMPNCIVRIYLPPAEQWENRSGPHFGFRFGCRTTAEKPREGFLAFGSSMQNEPYWPGIWINFRSQTSRRVGEDSAFFTIRSDARGRDFRIAEIDRFGWWTLGMSMTADGQIHYFASQGVDPLTAEDYLTSQFPYGYRAERVATFFFNVCNQNDGRSWSTPFVIDDAELFVMRPARINSIVERRRQYEQRRAQVSQQRQQSRSRR